MYRLSLILGASLVGLLSFVDLVEARLTNKNEGGLTDDEVGVSVFGTTHRSRKNMPEIKIDGNVKDSMNNRNLRGGKGRGTKGGKGTKTKAGKRRKRASKASKHHFPNLFPGNSPTTFPTPSGNDITSSTSSTIGSTPATTTTTIPPPTTPRPSPKLLTFAPKTVPETPKFKGPETPKFKGMSPTTSPTISLCTITEGYSNGSAGNLTLITDSTGNLVLAFVKEDGTNDTSPFSGTTLGTARGVTTVIEDINYFIIHAGQTVDVLGTVEVKAIGVDIQEGAVLNGNGGGYTGGARRTSYDKPGRKNGSGPGSGQGGWNYAGGAGAGHGGNGGDAGFEYDTAEPSGGSSYSTSAELQPGSGGGGGSGDNENNGPLIASGGRGGNGGAALRLFAVDTIKIDGSILSNGENGEGCTDDPDSTCGFSGGGGGSGGSISLSACTMDAGSSSLVQANGGNGGRSRRTFGTNCGGGGGGGGVIKTEMINTVGTLVLQVDGGAQPSAGRKKGEAGNVGKVFLTDILEVGESCDLPSYLDLSTPLDKNLRCASAICRSTDNKCGCIIDDHCDSSEVCHSDNKCYSSGLGYDQDCAADNGDDVDARCSTNLCRNTDNKCGCTNNGHCSSGEACHLSDNKCYVSDLSYGESCLVNDDRVEARCASGLCRSSDNKCGCDDDTDCSNYEICTESNTCVEGGKYTLKAFCSSKKNALSTSKKCVGFFANQLQEYCTTSQCNPNYPNDSYIEIESPNRIRLEYATFVLKGDDKLKLDGFRISLEGQDGQQKTIDEWIGQIKGGKRITWDLSEDICGSTYFGVSLLPNQDEPTLLLNDERKCSKFLGLCYIGGADCVCC